MNYCSQCGEKVTQEIPKDDNRLRYVCTSCGFIHYQNPNIVAGVLPLIVDTDGIEKILLCRRAIEPRHGYWTLPAGFMENEESLEEGAAREANEEANLILGDLKLYMVVSLPYISQVYMMFIGKAENNFSPGVESLETKLFSESEIPWDELAFPVIEQTLTNYFSDKGKLINSDMDKGKEPIPSSQINDYPLHNYVYRKN